MEETNHAIARWLTEAGWSETYVNLAVKAVIILGILVVAYAAAVLFRRLIVPLLQKISARTKAVWDDHLFSDKVMHRAARLIPPLIWYVLLRVAFYDTPVLLNVLHKACLIYLIVAVLQLVAAFLDTLYEISSRHETLRNRPLKGVYQMIKLLAVCVGAILIVSILIGQDATAVLAGLGASAAIIMLIFRDSILGLVAGVQLSANDMLRPGDWITMAKYGADGYVTEVTLTTVKVQNFDKTITTIPPYALVSDSFQNWRGMWDSGGRRIKRSLLIDASSVHNCTAAELADAVDMTQSSSPEEHVMLSGIVNFVNTEVQEIMKPRVDITALSMTADYETVKRTIIESGFSRIPVYEEDVDNIRGTLYVKDLLPYINNGGDFAWQQLIRKPYFVPEHKKINDLLADFQSNKVHMAIVVDEYGSTLGLVSLEDIIEEIVGEISDESDNDECFYTRLDAKSYIFEGKTHLGDFERILDIGEDVFADVRGEAETLAGLMLELKRDFPRKGDVFTSHDLRFTVQEMDGHRVDKIRVDLQ